ncbi:hypothetical protein [Methylobacterium sp. Leaf85]|uniref:hypothetical protein n=1 Tax=Methylobacterium sp. Leaf85 TaxID=1736241 RepID=UPI0006F73087
MTDVYRNLTLRCWSIRERGRVVAHAPSVTLAGAVMVVRPGSRARVLRIGHREVHAWIRGDLIPHAGVPPVAVRLRYRPFLAGHFTDDCGLPIEAAAFVFLDEDGRAWHSETGTPALE